MTTLKAIGAELIGIFVDRGFAIAILAWILVACLILPRLGLPPAIAALILFAGLVAILLESTTRKARLQ